MVEGDIELDPDQMAAYMEQMEKAGSGHTFAAIKTGLWKTNGKADTIKYYIDPQISESINQPAFSMMVFLYFLTKVKTFIQDLLYLCSEYDLAGYTRILKPLNKLVH